VSNKEKQKMHIFHKKEPFFRKNKKETLFFDEGFWF